MLGWLRLVSIECWCCLQQLSAIHEEYDRVKSGLAGHTASVQQSLNVIESGLVQIVTKLVVLLALTSLHLLSC